MLRLAVDPRAPDADALHRAALALARGAVVAMPTDTFYGLAADPRNPRAVALLYRIKGRAREVAVPLVASDLAQVEEQVGRLSPMARRLAARFWPGALTLIVEASPRLAPDVHGGSGRVAVRVPDHPVPRELARLAGHPLTATSANRSGEEAPSTADELIAALGDDVDVVLDAGRTPGGLPSTIIDTTGPQPTLVRAGAVPWERVLEFLQNQDS